MIVLLVEREDIAAQSDIDVAVPPDASTQNAFEFRLVEAVGMIPSVRTNAAARDQYEQLAFGVHVPNVATDAELRQQRFRQSHGLEQPHALAVERNRPRHVIDRWLALEDGNLQPAHTEQVGHRCANRPIADDRNVNVRRGHDR